MADTNGTSTTATATATTNDVVSSGSAAGGGGGAGGGAGTGVAGSASTSTRASASDSDDVPRPPTPAERMEAEKDAKARAAALRAKEKRMTANTKAWLSKVLVKWPHYKDSKLVRSLCWQGIPPAVRGVESHSRARSCVCACVALCSAYDHRSIPMLALPFAGVAWPMMISNTLQVTPDLFKIFRTHAQALRRDVNAMLAQEDARLKAQEAAFAAGGADAVKALEKAGGAGGGAGADGSDDGSDGAGECVL